MNPDGFFADSNDQVGTKPAHQVFLYALIFFIQSCSVKVAVRVRPLVGREMRDGNHKTCVESNNETRKIQIGTNEFSFDSVFNEESYQEDIYAVCSRNLILGCFAGYNATILAYGQTGSGKTHTMGTGSTVGLPVE